MRLEKLNRRIRSSGYMQKHIAEMLGVSPPHLCKVLKGRLPLTTKMYKSLNFFLNK